MTVLAVGMTLLVAAAAAWWIAHTPGWPTARADVPPWTQAAATRALIAVFVCAASAGAAGNIAPEAGVWPWLGAIAAALTVIALTAIGWVTDSTKRVPTMAFLIGWALLAIGVGVWVTLNTDPIISDDAVDLTRPFAVGQRAALLVGLIGLVHTWWVWRSRARRRRSTQTRREAQIRAMRARIDREQQHPTTALRGRRR